MKKALVVLAVAAICAMLLAGRTDIRRLREMCRRDAHAASKH